MLEMVHSFAAIFSISKIKLQHQNIALLEQWHLLFHFAGCELVAFVTGEFELTSRPY